nr:MAG: transcription elongation factor S-II [Diabrotica toursvirus 3a]
MSTHTDYLPTECTEYRKFLIIRKLKKEVVDVNVSLVDLEKLIKDIKEDDEIISVIKLNRIYEYGFQSKCFKKYENETNIFLKFLEEPGMEDSAFSCSKCKSKKILTMSKQTRRSDESTTVFAHCTSCSNKWVL